MDITELIDGVAKLGLGGIVFVIWYFDNKKMTALQEIIKEQVEEKKLMREEREHFITIIVKSAVLLERATNALTKFEERNPNS